MKGTTKKEAATRRLPDDMALNGVLDLPILYEDEGQEEMGDSDIHTRTTDILFYGLQFHLGGQGPERVFADLNLHYLPRKPKALCLAGHHDRESEPPLAGGHQLVSNWNRWPCPVTSDGSFVGTYASAERPDQEAEDLFRAGVQGIHPCGRDRKVPPGATPPEAAAVGRQLA